MPFVVRRAAGNDRDNSRIADTLRNIEANLCRSFILMSPEGAEFGGRQITGISIERLKKSVKRAYRNVIDVWFSNVVALDLVQHLFINAHLAVSAIALRTGRHSAGNKSAEKHNGDEGNRDAEDSALNCF